MLLAIIIVLLLLLFFLFWFLRKLPTVVMAGVLALVVWHYAPKVVVQLQEEVDGHTAPKVTPGAFPEPRTSVPSRPYIQK
jgi:hypothetical protein